jgi:hypothetical protein
MSRGRPVTAEHATRAFLEVDSRTAGAACDCGWTLTVATLAQAEVAARDHIQSADCSMSMASVPQALRLWGRARLEVDPIRLDARLTEVVEIFRGIPGWDLVTEEAFTTSAMATLEEGECYRRGCDAPPTTVAFYARVGENALEQIVVDNDAFCGRHTPTRSHLKRAGVIVAVTREAVRGLLRQRIITATVADLVFDPGPNLEEVTAAAVSRWEQKRQLRWTGGEGATEKRVVDHLRHRHSNYDQILGGLVAGDAQDEAVQALRVEIYRRIAEAHPALTGECRLQLGRRGVYIDLTSIGAGRG